MTIKEVEAKTGIARSSIRFYEKEQLIKPARNSSNGYRDYTEEDVENINKIAYLRTLGISLENIRHIINHEIPLRVIIEKQEQTLEGQIGDLERARLICRNMLAMGEISYDDLDIEAYTPELSEHWKSNHKIFKMDSVGFLYMWGGSLTWGIIAGISLLLSLLLFSYLPADIPIQWDNGEVSSEAGRIFIFAYPAACVAVRFILRPFIWRWTQRHFIFNDAVSDYLTNYLCFIALSVEIFTILFVNGLVKHVASVLVTDTAVLIGILLTGWRRWNR